MRDRSQPSSAERDERDWVLHVDLDQFLAAVEVLRRPDLVGRPVVVGGDGDPTRPRQVVATASYEARAYGVRSGMPLRTALRRCPDAVFLPSDRPAYEAASVRVMAALRSLDVAVEEWGWDEACVGARTADPEAFARHIQATVFAETQLRCAVGIGETKLQAKTATGFAKPGGVARLTRRTWLPVMGDRAGDRDLRDRHPVRGPPRRPRHHHRRRSRRGRPPRAGPPVRSHDRSPPSTARSGRRRLARRRRTARPPVPQPRGHVRAGPHRPGRLAANVVRLAEEVTASVADLGRRITHVAVKVRTATFFTRSKSRQAPRADERPAVVVDKALAVLTRFESGRPIRLLGVRVDLEDPPDGRQPVRPIGQLTPVPPMPQ